MIPRTVTTTALIIGRYRLSNSVLGSRSKIILALTVMIPMIINTIAKPTEKHAIKPNPKVMRRMAMAVSITAMAEGHGTIPPDMPNHSS